MTFLSGEPRSISSIELLTIVVVPCVLILRSSYWLNSWRLRVAYVVTLAVGFVWGVGIGLIQLLPGWSFINYSERNSISYAYFGAGSLAARWSALLFTPDLFGGNGAFGQPGYFANYNLAEVTGYAGVLALVAGVAFLTRVRWRGWRGDDRDYMIYVVILVVGLFATWGSFTPLGHIFHKIPLYGSTRLQSRSVILVDFPLSVFLGWWLQRIREGATSRAGLGRRSRWVSAAPALVIVVGSVLLLGWGPWVLNKIHISGGNVNLEEGLRTSNVLHLLIALVAALAILLPCETLKETLRGVDGGTGRGPGGLSSLYLHRPHRRSRSSRSVGVVRASACSARAAASPSSTRRARTPAIYRELGEPNMNVFTHLASVQGYGSLISNIYDDATGRIPRRPSTPVTWRRARSLNCASEPIAISSSAAHDLDGLSRVRFLTAA